MTHGETLYRAAIHESAHAVAYLHLGRLALVEIDRETGEGTTHGALRKSAAPHDWGIISLAGVVAETLLAGGDVHELLADGIGEGDLAIAHCALGQDSRELDYTLGWTRQFVRERWPAINRVAAALIAAGELSGAEVEALLGRR